MRHMPQNPLRPILLTACLGALSACSLFQPPTAEPPPVAAVSTNPMGDLGQGVTAASLDTSTEAEKAAALQAAPTSEERALGSVTVALGSPTEPGFWLKSSLVSVAAKGRVETGDGRTVAVELLPFDGAALLSFAAFRSLELSLTDLPDVTVYSD